MDEDQSQVPAGDQEGKEGTPDGEGQPQGPSDEMKMKRLEEDARKLREEKERLAQEKQDLIESQRQAERRSMSDDDRFNADKDDFYRDKAKVETLRTLEAELAAVPESVKNRIAEDPFKWVDKDVLQFELMKVDTNNPAEVWEATAKAAKRSLPAFISDLKVAGSENPSGEKNLGNNPSSIEGDEGAMDTDSLWNKDMDELRALKKRLNR